MKKIFLIIGLVLFSSCFSLSVQPPDSCLKMIWDNEYNSLTQTGGVNPDSVKIDSCIGSVNYGKLYAKKYFTIVFKVNNFPFDYQLKPDSIKRVSDISNSKPEIKAQLQQLETQLGPIYLQGSSDEVPDSLFWQDPFCRMFFNNYQKIDDVINLFSSTLSSLRDIHYHNRAIIPVTVEEINNDNENINIYPNPVRNTLDLRVLNLPKYDNVLIFNLNGIKIIETKYMEKIDITSLNEGVYLLICGDKTYKFIKQN